MAVTFRFARLGDSSLRLRVRATEPHVDLLTNRTGACIHQPIGGAKTAQVVVEGPAIPAMLDRLLTSEEPLAGVGAQAYARLAELSAQPPPGPVPADVMDDAALRALVLSRPAPNGALVVEELSIADGAVRADVAVLTEQAWWGVELKGERDTLARLPGQVAAYSALFDHCEVLTTPNHTGQVLELVPAWWTVSVATSPTQADTVRVGSTNPDPDARARAGLLWRGEAAAELTREGTPARSRTTRTQLHDELAQLWDPDRARERVTAVLRSRTQWRTGPT